MGSKKSKRGVTLVEVIISAAMVTLIVAAAYALLNTTQASYYSSTKNLTDFLESSTLQTYIESLVPISHSVSWEDYDEASFFSDPDENKVGFSFKDEKLYIYMRESTMAVDKVEQFTFSFKQLGSNASGSNARAHFTYSGLMSNEAPLNGGVSLDNTSYFSLPEALRAGEINMTENSGKVLVFYLN